MCKNMSEIHQKYVWRPGSAGTRWVSTPRPHKPQSRGPTSKGRKEGMEGKEGIGRKGGKGEGRSLTLSPRSASAYRGVDQA